MWELAACKDTRKSVAFADFAEGPTPREARSGVVTPLPTELTIRDARAGAFLEPRGPLTKRTLRVPLSALASAASPRGRPQAPRTANRPTPRCRRRGRAEITPRRAATTTSPQRRSRDDGLLRRKLKGHGRRLVSRQVRQPAARRQAREGAGHGEEALLEQQRRRDDGGVTRRSERGVPSFTSFKRVVSGRGGRGWSLFRF